METGQVLGTTLTQCTVLEGDKEPPDIRPFELYLVLQVSSFHEKLINVRVKDEGKSNDVLL